MGTGRGRAFDRLVELEVVGWLETHMLMTLLPFPGRMLLEHSWGNADVLDTGLGKESRAWVFIYVRCQMPGNVLQDGGRHS